MKKNVPFLIIVIVVLLLASGFLLNHEKKMEIKSTRDNRTIAMQDGVNVPVADFRTFTSAKSGDIGGNFRRLPSYLVVPNRVTAPNDNSPVTCVVDESTTKAVNTNGGLIGECENAEAVISRLQEAYKRR